MFVSPFVAALLIGTFWTGVGVTAAANGGFDHFDRHRSDVVISATTTDHDDACAAKYRSYQADSGKFMGNDGRWHTCKL
jgi:hypothetical protein